MSSPIPFFSVKLFYVIIHENTVVLVVMKTILWVEFNFRFQKQRFSDFS
jgi:hypothetical protein